MTNLLTKIRNLLSDNSTSGFDVTTYTTSSIFSISEPNVNSVTEVYNNSVSSGVTYSYNSSTNQVTVTSSLTAGDSVQIDYTYYPNYSDTELTNYVRAALVHLSTNNYYDFQYDADDDYIYPDLTPREENLVALIASTLIDPGNRTIRLPDISIQEPDDLPVGDKISKYIGKFKRDTHGVFDVI